LSEVLPESRFVLNCVREDYTALARLYVPHPFVALALTGHSQAKNTMERQASVLVWLANDLTLDVKRYT
jgi:hypothetical protein